MLTDSGAGAYLKTAFKTHANVETILAGLNFDAYLGSASYTPDMLNSCQH